jgi:hypothetical protein
MASCYAVAKLSFARCNHPLHRHATGSPSGVGQRTNLERLSVEGCGTLTLAGAQSFESVAGATILTVASDALLIAQILSGRAITASRPRAVRRVDRPLSLRPPPLFRRWLRLSAHLCGLAEQN